MKFMHCSDLHLGKRPVGASGEYAAKRHQDYFDAFEYLIRAGIDEKISAIILSGDIFDKKELNPDVLYKAETILNLPKSVNIPVVITDGNHDRISKGAEHDSWLHYLAAKGLLLVPKYERTAEGMNFTPVIIDDIAFYGLGYSGAFAKETIEWFISYLDNKTTNNNGEVDNKKDDSTNNMGEVDNKKDDSTNNMGEVDNKIQNVAIIHTGIIDNIKERDDSFITGTIDRETADLFKGKVIYAAGGHLHSYRVYPKDKPYFFVPGSPEFWDIDEAGKAKGAIIFDTDSLEHKFIAAKNRKVHKIVIRNEFYAMDELLNNIKEELSEINIEQGEDILRIDLEIINSFVPDVNAIEAEMANIGILKTFVKFIGKRGVNNESTAYSSIEILESEIVETWEIFGKDADKTIEYLSKFKTHTSEGNLDQLTEEFDAFMNEFIAGDIK